MEKINLDEIQPLLDQDPPPPEPKKEKKPVKKTAPKKERRDKKQIMEAVAKVNQKISHEGMAPTAACEEVKLNYQTFKRHTASSPSTATTGDVSEIGRAVADFQKAAERLRNLGATFTVSKIKFDISV